MKRISTILTTLGLLFVGEAITGQTNLRIINPQRTWQNQQGVIESAALSIRPKGLYAECGLYLTFSERGSGNYFSDDSLEVVLNFQLPEAAMVHDSWLWIDDHIAVARIMDRWSATQIYEAIVNRREDPSILVKNSPTQYSLRVYPLLKGQTRRVKITYMMPMAWSRHSANMDLPTTILNTSRINLPELDLIVWPEGEWVDPTLIRAPNASFTELFDSVSGRPYLFTALPNSDWIKRPKLSFLDPIPNGIYLNKWNDGDDGVYQLAVLPALFTENSAPRKVAILFDHQSTGSPNFTYPQWLDNTRTYLETVLEPRDSFNLFFSQLLVTPYSPGWLPADPATIQQVFEGLSQAPNAFQNLPGLFSSAIQFIQNTGGQGHIILQTNASQFANIAESNGLIEELKLLMGQNLIPITSVDFRSLNFPVQSGLYGNAYLLTNLAQQTGGSYLSARSNSWLYESTLELGFQNLWDKLTNFEINTSVQSGFCYGRLTPLHSAKYASPVYLPVMQIGKFFGQFPMNVTVTGLINDNIFFSNTLFQESNTEQGDSLNLKVWNGTFIQALERETTSSLGIPQIIAQSISARVLSRYTAFLCLEDPGTYCDNCIDETLLTSINDIVPADSLIRVSPNPFTDFVEIEIKGAQLDLGRTTIEILDLSGRLMAVLQVEQTGDRAIARWDGKNRYGGHVPAGVYVALIRNKALTRTVKIVKAS